MRYGKLLSSAVLIALFVFLHAPRAESFFSSGFSFSAGSSTIGASGSAYSGRSWSSVSSSSGTASEESGSVSVFVSIPVTFNSVGEAEAAGILAPGVLTSVLNGIGQEESISAVTIDSGLAALAGGEDVLQSLVLQHYGGTVYAKKVTTRHTNGVQYKEITKFSELLDADSGDSDFQIYSVKGLPLYSMVYAESGDWEDAFERITYFECGYLGHTIGEIVSEEEADRIDFSAEVRALAEDSETIAAFFTKAEEEGVALKTGEVTLRETLLSLGVLESKDGKYTTPMKVVFVMIDPENINNEEYSEGDYKHEISHAFFATDETYKRKMADEWNKLTSEAKEEIKRSLAVCDYSVDRDDMVIDEFAAQCIESGGWDIVLKYGGPFLEIFEDKFADHF